MITIVIRTSLEDRVLLKELEGNRDQQSKYITG